jgi:hypothetical protein
LILFVKTPLLKVIPKPEKELKGVMTLQYKQQKQALTGIVTD